MMIKENTMSVSFRYSTLVCYVGQLSLCEIIGRKKEVSVYEAQVTDVPSKNIVQVSD